MLRSIAIVASFLLASPFAHAGDPRCNAPPYGAASATYSRALQGAEKMIYDRARAGAAPSAELSAFLAKTVPGMAKNLVSGAYRQACLTKLDGVDVDKWGDADVSSLSIAQLASLIINNLYSAPSQSPTSNGSRRPLRSDLTQDSSSSVNSDYMTVTSNVPACPSKADIKMLLSAASDKTAWPKAVAIGEQDGCIELHAGDHIYPVGSDMWSALIQVRPEGHARSYWTDTLVVK